MNHHLTTVCMAALSLGIPLVASAEEKTFVAAMAVNALGLDLLAKGTEANANALLSPYSIQSALAMTYAGADGDTHAQMAKTLHFPQDESVLHQSFADLQQALDDVAKSTTERAKNAAQEGGPGEPVMLTVANRLFGQQGYEFRQPFLEVVRDCYKAPFQAMDFIHNADKERLKINGWVEDHTHQRIRDLIPAQGLGSDTRLVLVNAIYMKAPWAVEFPVGITKPLAFHVKGTASLNVPTMSRQAFMGYVKRDGYQVITVPYFGNAVQLLVLLPDTKDGLAAMAAKLTPEILSGCANPNTAKVVLFLPKFKLEPPLFKLSKVMQTLGMASAFDKPKGSANFDRMAPRHADEYLYISEVFHKTFLTLDEKGTEAAAATAVVMAMATAMREPPKPPIEVRVDRPFLFAIQHRPSGACLFIGRITDPR